MIETRLGSHYRVKVRVREGWSNKTSLIGGYLHRSLNTENKVQKSHGVMSESVPSREKEHEAFRGYKGVWCGWSFMNSGENGVRWPRTRKM